MVFFSINTPGSAAYEPNQSYIIPQIDQNGCLSLGNGGLNGPVENHYSMWPIQATPNGHSQSAAIHPLHHIQQDPPGTNQFNLGEEYIVLLIYLGKWGHTDFLCTGSVIHASAQIISRF